MTLHIVSDPLIAKWVLDHMPQEGFTSVAELGPYIAFGVTRDRTPLCGVIYNWYRELPHGNDMRAILYADNPGWCLPGVLRQLFSYPFVTANCSRLTAVVRDGNERALKLNRGLGFRQEGVLRRGYDGKANAILLGMLKSECKWLHRGAIADEQEGQQFATARARPPANGVRANPAKRKRGKAKRRA